MEGNMVHAASPLETAARSHMVYQNRSHGPSGESEQMLAILPVDTLEPQQSKIELVHESRRLKRRIAATVEVEAPGNRTKTRIHERNEFVDCRRIALVPLLKQFADVVRQSLRVAERYAGWRTAIACQVFDGSPSISINDRKLCRRRTVPCVRMRSTQTRAIF
jgi:hypothetical protein